MYLHAHPKEMCNDDQKAQVIGLDWGTSSLRAYLLGQGGQVLAENSLPLGIMPVRRSSAPSDINRAFERALGRAIGEWIAAAARPLPIVAAGMVGSAQGWQEVPYLRIPFDVRELGSHLGKVRASDGTVIHLVPGLLRTCGLPNVMRGEETQVLGILSAEGNGDVPVGLPGTHSKWCFLQGGCIEDFETFITGELYAALRQHTIIGQTMNGGSDGISAAFDRGVEVATSANGLIGDLSTIFSVRSRNLVGQLTFEEQPDYFRAC
jgi:2-dehydro-3-deoxygalactonokinase